MIAIAPAPTALMELENHPGWSHKELSPIRKILPGPSLTDTVKEARARIIVVDDDEQIRLALSEILADLGFVVLGQGADGTEAVQLVDELGPEVVLMDMRMPVMDGIMAAKLIKHRHPAVQIVVLSAYEGAGLQQGAEEAGVTCYLVKGCKPGLIRDALQSASSLYWSLQAARDDSGGTPMSGPLTPNGPAQPQGPNGPAPGSPDGGDSG